MRKLIVVSDWSYDDLSRQEFRSAVAGFLTQNQTPLISFVNSTSSTIQTAFLLFQIAEIEERLGQPQRTIIFQNTDPRLQTNQSIKKAQGAEFLIIKLQSNIFICGPNAGYDFSLIKPKIDIVSRYPGLDKGSQFRSRELFSRVCAHLLEEMEDELELEEISSNVIPELRGYFVAHVDNFGNIKTTIKLEDFKGKYEFGEQITIKINKIEKKARFVTNLFGGSLEELVIYPGSSGYKDNPFLEISSWSHFTEDKPKTGAGFFNFPRPGQEIMIK